MAPDKLPNKPPRASGRPVGWAIVLLAIVIGIIAFWAFGGGLAPVTPVPGQASGGS